MSLTPFYPRGNPLTESMPFTARDGGQWLAYIEGVSEPPGHRRNPATLPGRRLRFDSAAESRVTSELPAGSPFLSDARLQDLLDQAQPVPPSPTSTWQSDQSPAPAHPHRVTEWAARVGKLGSAALADSSRRWREGPGRRHALRERARRFLSAALEAALTAVLDAARALVALAARIASGRRRARPDTRPADPPLAEHSPLARRWRGARSPHHLRPR